MMPPRFVKIIVREGDSERAVFVNAHLVVKVRPAPNHDGAWIDLATDDPSLLAVRCTAADVASWLSGEFSPSQPAPMDDATFAEEAQGGR